MRTPLASRPRISAASRPAWRRAMAPVSSNTFEESIALVTALPVQPLTPATQTRISIAYPRITSSICTLKVYQTVARTVTLFGLKRHGEVRGRQFHLEDA